jgi:hypothetical protein
MYMNAYLVSHNGMGDNLFMIGALHFLLKFYEKIYFLCKSKYYPNVNLFFMDNPNIICLPFNEDNETEEIKQIINANYEENDIFICGFCHTSYLKSKITQPELVNYKHIDKNYTIDFDTLTSGNYSFIADFYRDINLNLTYFYDYFYLPTTKEAIELYKTVQAYYIIFIQLKSSDGKELNIKNLLEKHLYDKNTILLCNDKNLYDISDHNKIADTKIKYNICQSFMYNKLVHYKEVIQNSDEIYIIDSCFIGMVLPYLKTNQLKAKKVRIIRRDIAGRIEL